MQRLRGSVVRSPFVRSAQGTPTDTLLFHTSLFHRDDVMVVGEGATAPTIERKGTGKVVKGLRIFRAGTFKDSRGVRRTWTQDHLKQMAAHYEYLKSTGVLPNVPTREGHTLGQIDKVVGYFEKLYVDPTDPNFVCADVEFTTADGADKWENGTYRGRSAEIAAYETNTGETYFPTVVGLAFVDIPAVEGLYSQADNSPLHFSHAIADKELPMDPNSLEAWLAAGKTADQWTAAVNHAASVEQFTKACNYAAALEAHFQQAQQLGLPKPGDPPVQHQAPPPLPPALPGNQPAAPPAPLTFAIDGNMVSDPAQVQSHIHILEQFRSESIEGGRIEYVNGLVNGNKMPKTMQEDALSSVKTMDDAGFASFKKMWDAAPVSGLLANHGAPGTGNQTGPAQPGQPAFGQPDGGAPLDDIATAQEIVSQHQRAGKPIEFIKGTKSFKKLEAAGKAPELI